MAGHPNIAKSTFAKTLLDDVVLEDHEGGHYAVTFSESGQAFLRNHGHDGWRWFASQTLVCRSENLKASHSSNSNGSEIIKDRAEIVLF
jgi:hypothetical protein